MIKSKREYKYYLECDRRQLFHREISWKEALFDPIWRFQKALRKCEYLKNTKKKIRYLFAKIRLRKLSYKLGFSISENCFAEGLSIAHYGNIVVNPRAKIGRNCRIHVGVNIGSDARGGGVPLIGNNVYIGPGAKIFGGVVIGDNSVIGANAVVNKSFPEGNITVGGVPAKKISEKSSADIIKQ